MSLVRISFTFTVFLLYANLSHPIQAQENRELVVLKGKAGIKAVFEVRDSSCRWVAYRDAEAKRQWDIGGHCFSLEMLDGKRTNLNESGFERVMRDSSWIVLETDLPTPPITVRQIYFYCSDGRTLRIQTFLRSRGEPIKIKRIGLLEITVSGEKLRLTGPDYVSSPIFGERIFAGIEHPSAECRVRDDTLFLGQSPYITVGKEWVDLPPAVFGSASDTDFLVTGDEALRRAFIRYLNTVRIKPLDMHVYYNDWWTAPIPNTQAFVLGNIDQLMKDLYYPTGFFFDSYIIDAGWSNIHSLWEINYEDFPDGFNRIRDALDEMDSRPGLWTSPSSLYPSTLDNKWLEAAGYEVTPNQRLGVNACLTIGGRYQTAYKNALLKHTRDANLAHIKFDGFIPSCDVVTHGHPTGPESYLPIAEGIMNVFDTLRASDSRMVLEPTCFGYHASPWWLLHVPSIIGPFGDDSPKGRCPSPDWLEAMTTAREIANLEGRDAFLMPSSALQCFDIVVQCPGAFQNHAVMAIGRGRWFISCYINPRFMDVEEWRFFADLMTWARLNRQLLQEPIPIGGNPANREAYGYVFRHKTKELFCLRNPWMEETSIILPTSPMRSLPRQVRSLYPRREQLARIKANESLPSILLGPYETKFVEVVAVDQQESARDTGQVPERGVKVSWIPTFTPVVKHFIFEDGLQALGPSWTCPEGDTKEILTFNLEGDLEVTGANTTELYILCEGKSVKSAFPRFELTINGNSPPVKISRSVGAFSAGGYTDEDWVWFITPFPEGRHHLALEVSAVTGATNFGVFLKGTVDASESLPPFEPGPRFPLFRPESRAWSHTILSPGKIEWIPPKKIIRRIDRINGVYLDALEWEEAITGWGEVQRNQSIQGQPMVMGGRLFHRGIGTHSFSRIVYQCPKNYRTFAATIGCHQTALAGTVVFVIEGDGKELYRSPVFRANSEPIDISIPINDIKELALIVEDSGDRINADHGNWAYARFLR